MAKVIYENISSSLGPELQIFLAELSSHLRYFELYLPHIFKDDTQGLTPGQASVFHHKFHAIRSAASFFELEHVESTAAIAEHLLETKAHSNEDDERSELIHELEQIIYILDQHRTILNACLAKAAS